MVLSPKLKEFDEENIVKYGVSVPVAGVRDGGSRELRDIALVMGAMLHLPKPQKAVPTEVPVVAPATDAPSTA